MIRDVLNQNPAPETKNLSRPETGDRGVATEWEEGRSVTFDYSQSAQEIFATFSFLIVLL